jgi:signal transduction histidine kinase/CheY-like chemotaxis protein
MNSKEIEHLNECLLKLSDQIDMLLSDQLENPLLLNNIDNWIKTHYNRIQFQRDSNNRIVLRSLDKQEMRDDAIFIFDRSLHVVSYSGTQNFFSDSNKLLNDNLSLLDIFDQADLPILEANLTEAIREHKNISMDLRVKTNINILNKCTFELDIESSNPEKNRYVAKLNFSQMLATQLLEYQALILDSLPGMDIYLFDKNYVYLFAAGKEKERFDLDNVSFIGKSLFNVLEKKAVRLIYPCISKALRGIENEGEIRYEGEVYYMKGTPVKDYNNETVGAILFSQNITSDKLLEEQLKKSREEALNADKLKSIFIANVSHEIRTPLNAIMGFTEQLGKTGPSPEQQKFIDLINKASDHLLYLVTEVVFLFKLGMGKVYLEKSPFSMHELTKELEETFAKQAADKNLGFKVNYDANFPDALIGDSFRLRQILMNLLVNAVKYTDRGEITFNCKVKKETKKRVDLVFEVKDTGVGITKHNLQRIFNVFEQGNKLNASFRGGAGLGLGICKNLVELLGGQISVTSKVKVGSTFTAVIPFDKASCVVHLEQKKINFDFSSDGKLLVGKKILLADDDEHNLILAENILAGWKADFVLVEDGQKAIEMLDKTKYDVALIDIHMPNKNGLDVIQHVRADNKNLNFKTPVLFMTANAFKSDTTLYLNAGFDDYLIKPFREMELYNKICNILNIDPGKNDKMLMVEPGNPAAIQKDVFDTTDLWKTSNGDRGFFEKMINNFIASAEGLVSVFINGAAVGNWQEIGEKAHKSIPSFKYFQLMNIAGSLEIIEDKTLRNIDYDLAANIIDRAILQISDVVGQARASLERKG